MIFPRGVRDHARLFGCGKGPNVQVLIRDFAAFPLLISLQLAFVQVVLSLFEAL